MCNRAVIPNEVRDLTVEALNIFCPFCATGVCAILRSAQDDKPYLFMNLARVIQALLLGAQEPLFFSVMLSEVETSLS